MEKWLETVYRPPSKIDYRPIEHTLHLYTSNKVSHKAKTTVTRNNGPIQSSTKIGEAVYISIGFS